MRFFTTAVSVALAAFAALTSAQASSKGNAFTSPTAGSTVTAGEDYTIQWMNLNGTTVSLDLMDGASNALSLVRPIVSGLRNTGTYTWSVPKDIPEAQTYTIRITYDNVPDHYNYSDRFLIVSDFVATTTSSRSSTTTSASSTSSSAATTSAPATTTASETTGSSTNSTLSTSSKRTSSGTSATSTPSSTGAPDSAGSTTLSSPLAVIMAILAAALFIH